jgi:hypothetical protein
MSPPFAEGGLYITCRLASAGQFNRKTFHAEGQGSAITSQGKVLAHNMSDPFGTRCRELARVL